MSDETEPSPPPRWKRFAWMFIATGGHGSEPSATSGKHLTEV